MDFDLQAGDGADMQMGQTHGGEVAVDRLDGQADGAQPTLLGACVRRHGVLVQGHEDTPATGADDRLVGRTVVGVVPVDPRPLGQLNRQLVEGGEVVPATRQEREGDGQAVRRADKVQAPAEDLVLLGRAGAAGGPPLHRPTVPGTHPCADGDGPAIADKVTDRGLSVGKQVPAHVAEQGQPVSQGMVRREKRAVESARDR